MKILKSIGNNSYFLFSRHIACLTIHANVNINFKCSIVLFFFFRVFIDIDFVSDHKNTREELSQYPAILNTRLINNAFVRNFLDPEFFSHLHGFPTLNEVLKTSQVLMAFGQKLKKKN